MKFNYQNYEIEFLYDDSYNNITLNIENTVNNHCYFKELTIDTFNKLQFEKNSNINNVKSGIHFFEKVLNNESCYTFTISENPHLLSNFKKINILNVEFKGILDSYFEIYCKFDIEERVFSMEEKVMRMMEKMKGNYEYKINNIENQLNNLQNMILNISHLIGLSDKNITKVVSQSNIAKIPSQSNISKIPSQSNITKVPSQNNITKVVSQNNITKVLSQNEFVKVPSQSNITKVLSQEEVPFIGLNYEEEVEIKDKELTKNIIIQKNKKNIKETYCEEHFYDTFYLSDEDEKVKIKENLEIIPKNMFITHYQPLVQSSTIPNILSKWYTFVNNSDEHIILNIERSYANLFVTNHGSIFIFHSYGGLVNQISLAHYGQINDFKNSVSIKDNHSIKDRIEKIKVLFNNIVDVHSNINYDNKVSLLNFFKNFDLFIENVQL
jgi:hypothetical protein